MQESVVNKGCFDLDLDEEEIKIMSRIDVLYADKIKRPTPRRY